MNYDRKIIDASDKCDECGQPASVFDMSYLKREGYFVLVDSIQTYFANHCFCESCTAREKRFYILNNK